VNTKPTLATKALILALVLMISALLAVIAGLLGHAYHRDPASWAGWTFATLSMLGVVICFGLWGS
jgi:Mg/Co/Ni transporter MgtE